MGKPLKKALKSSKNINEKNALQECQVQKEEKKRAKFWWKWSNLFNKPDKQNRIVQSVQPSYAVSRAAFNFTNQREDDSQNVDLQIPLEPGRQLSTIVLSPTKTGFKAVVAHYGVNASLKNLSKDFDGAHINRQTLTLVFDMEQRCYKEIGVGKNLTGSEYTDSHPALSAAELFVRGDEIVESTALLRVSSVDTATPVAVQQACITDDDDDDISTKRHSSCRSEENILKTQSEPIAKYNNSIQMEDCEDGIQDMLNRIIFLEKEDSLIGYFKEVKEPCTAVPILTSSKGQFGTSKKTVTVKKSPQKMFSFNDLSFKSSRIVAPDLLVNIKPFKEPIKKSSKVKKSQSVKIVSQRVFRPAFEQKKGNENSKMTKSKQSLCIMCGIDSEEEDQKPVRTSMKSKIPRKTCSSKSGVIIPIKGMVRKESSCKLCCIRKTYKKSNVVTLECDHDSLEEILKEVGGYDHTSIFRQNLSLFRSNVLTKDMKNSQTPLPYATKNKNTSKEPDKPNLTGTNNLLNNMQITMKLIDCIRNGTDKGAGFQTLATISEKSIPSGLVFSEVRIKRLETSCLWLMREENCTIRIEAQMIQLCMISYQNSIDEPNNKAAITPAASSWKFSDMMFRRHSEKIIGRKSWPFPDVINHLLTEKVHDLRKELIMRLNKTKLVYGEKSSTECKFELLSDMKLDEEDEDTWEIEQSTIDFQDREENAIVNCQILQPCERVKHSLIIQFPCFFYLLHTTVQIIQMEIPVRAEMQNNRIYPTYCHSFPIANENNVPLFEVKVEEQPIYSVYTETVLRIDKSKSAFQYYAADNNVLKNEYNPGNSLVSQKLEPEDMEELKFLYYKSTNEKEMCVSNTSSFLNNGLRASESCNEEEECDIEADEPKTLAMPNMEVARVVHEMSDAQTNKIKKTPIVLTGSGMRVAADNGKFRLDFVKEKVLYKESSPLLPQKMWPSSMLMKKPSKSIQLNMVNSKTCGEIVIKSSDKYAKKSNNKRMSVMVLLSKKREDTKSPLRILSQAMTTSGLLDVTEETEGELSSYNEQPSTTKGLKIEIVQD